MENNFTLKRYESIDDLLLASFQTEEEQFTMEEMKASMFGGLDGLQQEVEFGYDVQRDGIEKQGYWGFINTDTKVIHYWIKSDAEVPIQELIHFFGHEIGHGTGVQLEDDFAEEMRAEDFGHVAALAYELSFKALSKKQYDVKKQ